MLEVSSLKPLASESKGFAFSVELVAPVLPSAGYLSYVVLRAIAQERGFYLVRTQSGCGFPLSSKRKKKLYYSLAHGIK